MEKCNLFIPCVNTKNASTIQDEKWDEAVGYHNSQQYDKIIPTLIDYVNPEFSKYKTANGYAIPHGSVLVNIVLTEKEFTVECPFLHLKNAKKVPLMRRILELRLNPLDLANIVLQGDDSVFSFSCPLELCEPYKIYDVLKEICVFADMYDDEFIQKFDATHIQEPKVTPISENLKEEVYNQIQHLLEDNISRLDFYISKRDGNKAWSTLNIALKQLEFYAQPQGFLRTNIERAVDLIYRRDLSLHDILLHGKEELVKLKNYDKQKLKDDLYVVETFIPSKYSGKIDNIRENWEDLYDDIQEMLNSNEYEDASIRMLSNFYNLFYYNLVNDDVSKVITQAMATASGQSWKESAEALFVGMKSIMEDTINQESFGMDVSQAMQEQIQNSMSMLQDFMKGFSK